MWDDDEYVDTGGGSAPKTPTGGAAARRINQQRKAQAQTVKLPDNPFIDGDYADMTGHQRNEGGMEELRSTHQYKSMKARSMSTSRFQGETETDGIIRHASDVELASRDRNLSSSSSSSGSQTWRFKRSDTSPAFRSQGSITEKYADVQKDGSMRGVQPVIEEEDRTRSPTTLSNGNTGHTMPLDHQGSVGKSAPTLGHVQNSIQLGPSPSHSGVSVETATTIVKQSAPASPTVVYKTNGLDNNPDSPQVAIVVDEIKPQAPMYGSFANNSQKSEDKSTLKFDASPPRKSSKTLVYTVLGVLLVIALLAAVAVLAVILFQRNDKIAQLEEEITSLKAAASRGTEKPEISTTAHVTAASPPPVQFTSLTQSDTVTTIRSPGSPITTVTKREETTTIATTSDDKATSQSLTVIATTEQPQNTATVNSDTQTLTPKSMSVTTGDKHGSGSTAST